MRNLSQGREWVDKRASSSSPPLSRLPYSHPWLRGIPYLPSTFSETPPSTWETIISWRQTTSRLTSCLTELIFPAANRRAGFVTATLESTTSVGLSPLSFSHKVHSVTLKLRVIFVCVSPKSGLRDESAGVPFDNQRCAGDKRSKLCLWRLWYPRRHRKSHNIWFIQIDHKLFLEPRGYIYTRAKASPFL